LEAVAPTYPQFIDGVSVLHTGMNNMGAIFHPALTLLNAGRIESTHGDFEFYIEGVTPSVARVLEVLDRERVTVAAALGIRARSAMEWLKLAYDATGEDLNEAIHNQSGYYGIKAPSTLNHRYIFEDVPMSLVPLASRSLRGLRAWHGQHHPAGDHPYRFRQQPHGGETGHQPTQRWRTHPVRDGWQRVWE
jgi:opine dehydrogenase